MDVLDEAAVADYYREVAATLAAHLAGRRIHAGGWTSGQQAMRDQPHGPADIAAAVDAGARWFAWETAGDIGSVQLTPGDGADVATAATAALALIESIQAAGGITVPATDGQGGLLVFVTGPADLDPLLAELAERAPEIATIDSAGSDGRVWLSVAAGGSLVPAPYSLVDSADGTGMVLPLSADELAAVTAGMPLDPAPDEVAGRLASQGDLAAALLGH
ncbi:hypothetical protein [Nakamurella lactea]|uniref:hypothetical protein n=1 Tax=Nakamurella lactea TaxID=459515 RepID=UPI0003FC6125|nr:hypothetical protein [Nakamurella lactea]